MKSSRQISIRAVLRAALRIVALVAACAAAPLARADKPLVVCATTPDLADLVREIGGAEVEVTSFTQGPQDPHFLDAKPSFIKTLNGADIFVEVGLELEAGWAPVLLRSARNAKVRPGAPGFVDASVGIDRVTSSPDARDRSSGDVHPLGNPHYLLDPLEGLQAATTIRDALSTLRPDKRAQFEARHAAFRKRLGVAALGEELVAKYADEDLEKLLRLWLKAGLKGLVELLEKQKQSELAGGWLGALLPHRGAKLVADHDLWPHFARRFELDVVGFLEPKPGIAPTTKHLAELIARMRREHVAAVLSVPYFDARHAKFVAEHAGAKVAAMAHQTLSREGADGYIAMLDYNVRTLAAALRADAE